MATEVETNITDSKTVRKRKALQRKKPRTKAKAKKSKKAAGSGRPSLFSGKRIIKLVKENPRREGSIGFKSFKKIKSGMTYEAYLAAGGRRQDLAFDVAQKHVRVSR